MPSSKGTLKLSLNKLCWKRRVCSPMRTPQPEERSGRDVCPDAHRGVLANPMELTVDVDLRILHWRLTTSELRRC